jgi:alanine dehydrogenase
LVTPFLIEIGELGIEETLKQKKNLERGVYIHRGRFIKKSVAERFGFQ